MEKEKWNTIKKNQERSDNNPISPTRDRKRKQKVITLKKKQEKVVLAKQSLKKGRGKMTSSSDDRYEPYEELDSDSDFVEQPPAKKLRSISKGESSKSKKPNPVMQIFKFFCFSYLLFFSHYLHTNFSF